MMFRAVFSFSLSLLLTISVCAQASIVNMALIPGATFEMGQDAADIPRLMERFEIGRAELFQEEAPKHRVTIGSFYLDRTEVTNALFKSFVEKNAEWSKDKIPASIHNGRYLQHWNGNDFPADKAEHPVTFVTWQAAAAYCSSLGKRLPTEAEWEFAARGGLAGKAFPWGDSLPDKTRANYFGSDLKAPTKVGSYLANGYGLHDMAGNVWEFLADEWRKYPLGLQNDPGGLFKNADFSTVKTRRALRGGSYGGAPVNLRVTYRDSHMPDNAVEYVGFRCAMTSPQQSEDVNEILRMHYRDRAAHFNRDAAYIFSNFADEYFSLANGRVNLPDRAAGQKRLQTYFDAS
ncbi:MAG TPA: formylglycine-generating enzyme family protein, partial [Pyrinomonadaceae bacterium]